jgi:hypothetical protein
VLLLCGVARRRIPVRAAGRDDRSDGSAALGVVCPPDKPTSGSAAEQGSARGSAPPRFHSLLP